MLPVLQGERADIIGNLVIEVVIHTLMTGENTHELLTSSFFSNMGRDKCEEIISCYVLDEIC
jgi:hypothetical protein